MSGEGLWSRIAALLYKVGGSGTNLSLGEVLELEWPLFEWWLAWLEEQREAESAAIRKARQASSR